MDQSLPQQPSQPSATAEDSAPDGGVVVQNGQAPSPEPLPNHEPVPQTAQPQNHDTSGQTEPVSPQSTGIPVAAPSLVPPQPHN